MGIGQTGVHSEPIVALEEVVIRTLSSRGVRFISKTASGASWMTQYGRTTMFFPCGLTNGGYTQAQLNFIEACCGDCGVDLFPLDHHLM
jgi:hypothetical protein